MEEREEGIELEGGAAGFGFVDGDLLDAEVEAGGVAETCDEWGGVGEGKVESLDGDVSVFREGETDGSDAPDRGEGGAVGVKAGEEGGAGEGVGGGAVAVEHGVDLLGGGGVGGGDGVRGEDGDAEEAAGSGAYGDGVDVVGGVGLAGGGDGGEIFGQAGLVEVPDEDFGEGDGAVGAGGVGHLVEAEGDGVEVALEEDAGGVDELLVLGGVGDGFGVEVGGESDGPDVGVDDAVGLGEEAGGAGGGEVSGVEGQAREDEEEEGGEEEGAGAGSDLVLLGGSWDSSWNSSWGVAAGL